MITNELTYWVALAHTPKIWTHRKNEIVVYCFQMKKTLVDFFESVNFLQMDLTEQERELLLQTKNALAQYAFLVEELTNQGYGIVPITSEEYSPTLKTNLKYGAPIVLYTKGNRRILQEQSIAIVGSRNASELSLQFTVNVAKKASSESKVIVSGFAKGVDIQALDSTIAHNGHSIIVLPQGIATFSSGMKKYYKQIVGGEVLVLSSFYPKAPWGVDLAMARNPIIYGLSSDIYVAQSDEKGGTWSGVTDGLKRGRRIFVRVPEQNERCSNEKLISLGALPVDIEGELVQTKTLVNGQAVCQGVCAPHGVPSSEAVENAIIKLLARGAFSPMQIIDNLNLTGYSTQKMTSVLSKMSGVQRVKAGRSFKYCLLSSLRSEQLSLPLF